MVDGKRDVGATRSWRERVFGASVDDLPLQAPNGSRYLLRVRRRTRVALPTPGDPTSMAAEFILKNVRSPKDEQWSVLVIRPATAFRGERTMFTQHVAAQAIVVDVAMAVHAALERGDSLW